METLVCNVNTSYHAKVLLPKCIFQTCVIWVLGSLYKYMLLHHNCNQGTSEIKLIVDDPDIPTSATAMLLSSWGRATQRSTYLSTPVSTSCMCKAGLFRPFIPCTHQRKNSSSKSSNHQNDDPRSLAAPSEAVPKKTIPASTGLIRKRLATRLNRQRSKEAVPELPKPKQDEGYTQLPAVPSTQHLHPNGEARLLPLNPFSDTDRHPSGVLFLHTQAHLCNSVRTIELLPRLLFLHLHTSTSHHASSRRSYLHSIVCTPHPRESCNAGRKPATNIFNSNRLDIP